MERQSVENGRCEDDTSVSNTEHVYLSSEPCSGPWCGRRRCLIRWNASSIELDVVQRRYHLGERIELVLRRGREHIKDCICNTSCAANALHALRPRRSMASVQKRPRGYLDPRVDLALGPQCREERPHIHVACTCKDACIHEMRSPTRALEKRRIAMCTKAHEELEDAVHSRLIHRLARKHFLRKGRKHTPYDAFELCVREKCTRHACRVRRQRLPQRGVHRHGSRGRALRGLHISSADATTTTTQAADDGRRFFSHRYGPLRRWRCTRHLFASKRGAHIPTSIAQRGVWWLVRWPRRPLSSII